MAKLSQFLKAYESDVKQKAIKAEKFINDFQTLYNEGEEIDFKMYLMRCELNDIKPAFTNKNELKKQLEIAKYDIDCWNDLKAKIEERKSPEYQNALKIIRKENESKEMSVLTSIFK